MDHPKRCLEIDPDYKISETVLKRAKIKESREKQNAVEKVKEIINREFDLEFERRQKQLELIQQNLTKELQLSASEESVSNYINETSVTNKQSRIHPAVKKLLGNNFTNIDLNYSNTRRKRSKQIKYFNNTVTQESEDNTLKQSEIKEECKQEVLSENETQISDVVEELNYNFVRNRKKIKYRVVVGNISKWILSESKADNSTHKWMVYVRGPKEAPDISHFVQKVVFYLHPSYKPNDVVELSDSPFHLSRRGWGEFPLRVRIYFQCSLNKPVDVVHNLKLDRTYTGRQTLGNETVVDLFLYENESNPNVKDVESAFKPPVDKLCDFKVENFEELNLKNFDVKQEVMETVDDESYFEHDYCSSCSKNEYQSNDTPSTSYSECFFTVYDDHSYCVNNLNQNTQNNDVTLNVYDNPSITDLDGGDTNSNDIIEETVLDDFNIDLQSSNNIVDTQNMMIKKCIAKNFTKQNFQKIITHDGRVITIKKKKKPQQSLLKKIFQKKLSDDYKTFPSVNAKDSIESEEICYEVQVPLDRFKNAQETLPYLLKRLPIITKHATDTCYKCLYPYVTDSLEKYETWNIGKRMSCEWRRAKKVLELIKENQIYGCEEWDTKSVLLYARLHGYTPLTNYKRFCNHTDLKDLLLKYKTSPQHLLQQRHNSIVPELDVDVDVDSYVTEPEVVQEGVEKSLINITNPNTESICSYIRHSTLDKGVLLKNEEIVPGVLVNGAEKILLQAITSLADNLIRKSMAVKIISGNYSNETSINKEDVIEALKLRPEFSKIMTLVE